MSGCSSRVATRTKEPYRVRGGRRNGLDSDANSIIHCQHKTSSQGQLAFFRFMFQGGDVEVTEVDLLQP